MFGLTNARCVTWPDMQTELNGYYRTLWQSLYEEFLPKTVAAKNPAVGSLTRYAGFEWLVAHWDIENSVMYLALKDIYRLTCYSDSSTPGHPNVGFKDSVMEAEVFDFEAELRSRMRAASSTQAALSDMTSPLLNSDLSLLEDTEYDGITCKVFVPTRDQMTSVFELFKTTLSDETHGNFANAIALYNGEPMDWWLADNAVSALKPYVMKNGRYNKSTGTTQLIGFRPFVRMKMR